MKTSITQRIFETIKDKNLNQTTLAQTLGITETTVSEWKTGRSQPYKATPHILRHKYDVYNTYL